MLPLLILSALADEPTVLVGSYQGDPIRVVATVKGKKLTGTWQRGIDGAPAPLTGKARGEDWTLNLGDIVLVGNYYGGKLSGSVEGKDGNATPVTLGNGTDTPAVGGRDEVWTRARTDKGTGTDIRVSLPVVWVTDPALQQKIDLALAPEALLDQTRAEIEADGWVDHVSWDRTYGRKGLLSLVVTVEGSGAYPDTLKKYVVLDLKTGAVLGAEQFADTTALIQRADRMIQGRVRRAKGDAELADLVAGASFTADNLSGYSLSDRGVVFHYDFGFPHALLAAEPDGDVSVSWDDVADALAPDVALRRALK